MEITKSTDTEKKSKGINSKRFIVVHHTASVASDENIFKYLSINKAKVSVHYIVGKVGDIYKIGKHDDILWHAGRSEYDGVVGLNNHSIGIEVHSDGVNFSESQIESTIELIKYVQEAEGIASEDIVRHADIAPERKTDVGENFYNELGSWGDFQNLFNKNDQMSEQEKKAIEAVIATNSALWYTLPETAKSVVANANKQLKELFPNLS